MNRKKLKRRIRQCEAEIENIRTLPYYTLFNRESERAADLGAALRKLNSLQCSAAVGSRSRQRPHSGFINIGVKLHPSPSEIEDSTTQKFNSRKEL